MRFSLLYKELGADMCHRHTVSRAVKARQALRFIRNMDRQVLATLGAEAFNVTNTPPLGNPNGSFGNAAFGSITTSLDPRVFEFVLKIHF